MSTRHLIGAGNENMKKTDSEPLGNSQLSKWDRYKDRLIIR